MDEMIELNLNYLEEFNKDSEVKYTIDEARATMKEFFPQLKRWKQ
jgi:transcriptional regulator